MNQRTKILVMSHVAKAFKNQMDALIHLGGRTWNSEDNKQAIAMALLNHAKTEYVTKADRLKYINDIAAAYKAALKEEE